MLRPISIRKALFCFMLLHQDTHVVSAFFPSTFPAQQQQLQQRQLRQPPPSRHVVERLFPLQQSSEEYSATNDSSSPHSHISGRRSFISATLATNLGLLVVPFLGASTNAWGESDAASLGMAPASTETVAATTASSNSLDMKTFVDPYGMFDIEVPQEFYTLRRTAKADISDDDKGKRKGSSIFTAGNLAKAEVVAVDRFPVRRLLEENGIEATGNLSTFPDIGEPSVVAALIAQRRENDKTGSVNNVLDPSSVRLSPDGKEITFRLKTEIPVQRPELLMEQYGVDRLFRVTLAKASLNANDGNLLAVFASALETDFNHSPDGKALQHAVDSFHVMDREFGF
ncbi:hypothetical protein ACA910_020939 [Epithemia clementina (nom. ined.)]